MFIDSRIHLSLNMFIYLYLFTLYLYMHFLICLPIPFYTIYIRNIISDTFEMFHLIQIYFILLH